MKVAEFATDWIERIEESGIYSPQTVKTMRSNLDAHILPSLGAFEIPDITAVDLNNVARGYEVSASTNRRILATLSALLRDFEAETGESIPDTSKVRLRREQASQGAVALEVTKLESLAAQVGGTRQWEILFLAYTGLRIGEALALQWWRDVPVGRWGHVKVRESRLVDGTLAPTKNRRTRTVYCTDRAARALTNLWELRAPMVGIETPVLGSSRDQLRRALEPTTHPHALRHTYASLMLAAGAPITFVSEQMGHSNPAITLRVYSHFIGDPKSVIDSVNEALR